jgi:hypothetical protein
VAPIRAMIVGLRNESHNVPQARERQNRGKSGVSASVGGFSGLPTRLYHIIHTHTESLGFATLTTNLYLMNREKRENLRKHFTFRVFRAFRG